MFKNLLEYQLVNKGICFIKAVSCVEALLGSVDQRVFKIMISEIGWSHNRGCLIFTRNI